LIEDAPSVVRRRVPRYATEYRRHGWPMLRASDRMYSNQLAGAELAWQLQYELRFRHPIDCAPAKNG
jgi:hypothetical protein